MSIILGHTLQTPQQNNVHPRFQALVKNRLTFRKIRAREFGVKLTEGGTSPTYMNRIQAYQVVTCLLCKDPGCSFDNH